ncbi:unnamed protein product [Soboliphyme baturini]|uniref:Uncharacterized protein n=1 Tax=Soboliphyme baturini TaxID=241478 RepID=A0A183IQ65_9BILA|nr:unnamed protein product [Soboliphyme baturini]
MDSAHNESTGYQLLVVPSQCMAVKRLLQFFTFDRGAWAVMIHIALNDFEIIIQHILGLIGSHSSATPSQSEPTATPQLTFFGLRSE